MVRFVCRLCISQFHLRPPHSPPPPRPGYWGAFARLVSPGGGAFANFALPEGRAFANPGAIPEVWLACAAGGIVYCVILVLAAEPRSKKKEWGRGVWNTYWNKFEISISRGFAARGGSAANSHSTGTAAPPPNLPRLVHNTASYAMQARFWLNLVPRALFPGFGGQGKAPWGRGWFWLARGLLSEYNYTDDFTGKKADWLIYQFKDRNKLKKVVKACSRFYACVSLLLIKPELHSEIGAIHVNQHFLVIVSNFCSYYLKNILSHL